jgi:UDP-N-acetylglucosamine:LPS N-acetylglucosamine transferase
MISFPVQYTRLGRRMQLTTHEQDVALNLEERLLASVAYAFVDARVGPGVDWYAQMWSMFTIGHIPPYVFNQVYQRLEPVQPPMSDERATNLVFEILTTAYQMAAQQRRLRHLQMKVRDAKKWFSERSTRRK